jgi:glucose dehydrogenase
MAPIAYKGRVIVGVAGGEFGIRGFLAAYDIGTGVNLWKWYATDPLHWNGSFVPRSADDSDLHRDISAERRDAKLFSDAWQRGGGGIWTTPALDPASGTAIFTTGNPWPDYLANLRPGDNLYTNCIVAVDIRNGKLRWYFQEVPHDEWDLDRLSPYN